MTMIRIDFTNPSATQNEALFQFLKEESTRDLVRQFWSKNTSYPLGETTICFSHDFFWRKRTNSKEGERFEVISTHNIGKGNFGQVFKILATLAMNDTSIHERTHKARVVKIQCHKLRRLEHNTQWNDQAFTAQLKMLTSEYKNSKKAPHLKMKKPTVVSIKPYSSVSYMTMRQLPGHELFGLLIKSALNTQNPLTGLQRIEIGLAIVSAIKAQATDIGYIHRDIKPENIFVDTQQAPFQAFFAGLRICYTQ